MRTLLAILMKLIDRYLVRTFLMPLLFTALLFNLFFVIYDLFDNFDEFVRARTPMSQILNYYLHFLPARLWLIMPFTLILSVLYALYQLTRHNELTAMRASGISLSRILIPNLIIGLIVALLVGAVNETIAPSYDRWCAEFTERVGAAAKARETQDKKDKLHPQMVNMPGVEKKITTSYFDPATKQTWFIQQMDLREETNYKLHGPIIKRNHPGTMKPAEKISAESAEYIDGEWAFKGVIIERWMPDGRIPVPGIQGYEVLPKDTIFKPGLKTHPTTFRQFDRQLEAMTALGIKRILREESDTMQPRDLPRLRTEFHSRLARPFACFIAVIIGIPFGFHTARKGVFAGIVICLATFFAYYLFFLLFLALGKNGTIPAVVGGWLPNLLFLGVGILLYRRMRHA